MASHGLWQRPESALILEGPARLPYHWPQYSEENVANTRSAIKAMRQAERRRQRNRAVKTAFRTRLRRAQEAVATAPGAEETIESVRAAVSQLDRAVSKGVLHANGAARRKSRLMKKLNTAQTASA